MWKPVDNKQRMATKIPLEKPIVSRPTPQKSISPCPTPQESVSDKPQYSPSNISILHADQRLKNLGFEGCIEKTFVKSDVVDHHDVPCTVLSIIPLSRETGVTSSKEAIEFLEFMSSKHNEPIWHSKNGGEVSFVVAVGTGNKRIHVDGYSPSTLTVYEFNGDHYHANPLLHP
ncbi:MAG TPA: hypothetical protein VJ044_05530, partial [Candidatus Hodarchaeales archaeon]|nr:hypothetical protein [Candidatus Hodarchaeales archaeon]